MPEGITYILSPCNRIELRVCEDALVSVVPNSSSRGSIVGIMPILYSINCCRTPLAASPEIVEERGEGSPRAMLFMTDESSFASTGSYLERRSSSFCVRSSKVLV